MAAIPTIKVHYNGSWAYINQAEFDPTVHLEWQDGDEVIVEQLKAKAEAEAAVTASALFEEVESDEDEAAPVAEDAAPVAEDEAALESEDSEDEEQA